MRLLVDTNRYTDLARGVDEVVVRLQLAREVWLPVIVLGELKAGFAAGTRRKKNEAALRRFLDKPNVAVLLPDEETSDHYAQVYKVLRRVGRPIPTNDMWIAALAMQFHLTLDSADDHYRYVPKLKRIS